MILKVGKVETQKVKHPGGESALSEVPTKSKTGKEKKVKKSKFNKIFVKSNTNVYIYENHYKAVFGVTQLNLCQTFNMNY